MPEIRQIPPSSIELVFNVVEGPKVRVGKIDIAGNQNLSHRDAIRASLEDPTFAGQRVFLLLRAVLQRGSSRRDLDVLGLWPLSWDRSSSGSPRGAGFRNRAGTDLR